MRGTVRQASGAFPVLIHRGGRSSFRHKELAWQLRARVCVSVPSPFDFR